MDRQAFRNRMQQLKQYREQNPGKTYLDFKQYANGGELEASLPEITVTAKRVRPRIPGDITSQVQPLDMPTQLQPNTVDNNTYFGNNLDEVSVVANRVNKQAPNGIISNMVRTDIPRVNKLRPFNSLEQPSIVDNDLVITDQPDRLGDETITTELPFITNDLEITDTPDKVET